MIQKKCNFYFISVGNGKTSTLAPKAYHFKQVWTPFFMRFIISWQITDIKLGI